MSRGLRDVAAMRNKAERYAEKGSVCFAPLLPCSLSFTWWYEKGKRLFHIPIYIPKAVAPNWEGDGGETPSIAYGMLVD